MKMSLSDGEPEILAAGQDMPRGIAVDDYSVYWTNYAVTGRTERPGSVARLFPK